MAIITLTGNLTKDAELKNHEDRNYVLLQVAENIRKRNEQGDYEKDDKGHYINSATYYHSVFVNRGDLAFQAQNLKAGALIRISGFAKLDVTKDENDYDQNVIKRIVARYIDIDPFKLIEQEQEGGEGEEESIHSMA